MIHVKCSAPCLVFHKCMTSTGTGGQGVGSGGQAVFVIKQHGLNPVLSYSSKDMIKFYNFSYWYVLSY